MRITKRQLRLLIENFINEKNGDIVDTAQELGTDLQEYGKKAEKLVEYLKDYVEPSVLDSIKNDFVTLYKELEKSSPEFLSKLKDLDAISSKTAKKIAPYVEKTGKTLKKIGKVLLPVVVFSAAPLALYKTIQNLSSVEGKIRNQAKAVKQAYDRKLELSDISNKTGAFAEVSKDLGIKPLSKNEIINALALNTISPDESGNIIQRLINDDIISDSFAKEIYERAQIIKLSEEKQKDLAKSLFGVESVQPYHNVSLAFAASLLKGITGTVDGETASFIIDVAKDHDEYLDLLKKIVAPDESNISSLVTLADFLGSISKT
jgi:hypothetical protein